MQQLIRYDAACKALAALTSVDEAKSIRDKAVAVQAYARQAQDRVLLDQATRIRFRAEIRAGELLIEMAERGERPRGRKKESHVATLSDLHVTKTQSSRWQALASLTKDEKRRREVAAVDTVLAAYGLSKADRIAARNARLAKIAEIAKGNTALGTSTRYPIIYADPPWRYENPPMGGGNRSIENHYPTMTLQEIIALPIAQLAADDALLYLWATAPKLAECIDVLRAWGFEYRTNAVWDKEVIGMGYHFRNQHELLLIGKRGEIPPPPAGEQPSSVYRERREDHSVKPNFYYEMIEKAYPQLQKIELFARTPREGWASWGNQAAGVAA